MWVLNMSKRTDAYIERWWQGVGVGEVEPTIKVVNATRTVWNFQKLVLNVGEFCFGGLAGTLDNEVGKAGVAVWRLKQSSDFYRAMH